MTRFFTRDRKVHPLKGSRAVRKLGSNKRSLDRIDELLALLKEKGFITMSEEADPDIKLTKEGIRLVSNLSAKHATFAQNRVRSYGERSGSAVFLLIELLKHDSSCTGCYFPGEGIAK